MTEGEVTMKYLELGGGNNPKYHPNIDVRAEESVDIVASLEEHLPIESNSIDVVYSAYAIEHISWRKVSHLVSEIYRILKNNGSCVLITANLKEQAKVIASKENWEGDYENRLIFGDQDYYENSHRCGFSPEYITRLFQEAGFMVKVIYHPNCATDMIVQAHKTVDRVTWLRRKIKAVSDADTIIADIGCSDCPVTWDMHNVVKIDTEPYDKLNNAALQLRGVGFEKQEFIQANADRIPVTDKQFDVSLLTEVLEHVDDPVKVLQEAIRVTKKTIIITVPNEAAWDLKWKPFQNVSHVRHFTKNSLQKTLLDAGIYNFDFQQLDYDGWSFFIAVADIKDLASLKNDVKQKISIKDKDELKTISKNYIDDNSEDVIKYIEKNLLDNVVVKNTAQIKTDKKLKVAIMSTPFFQVPPKNYGGLERVVYDVAKGIAALGNDVTVFAPEGSNVEGCKMFNFGESVDTVGVDWLQLEHERLKRSKEALLNGNFDIIHGNNWFGLEYQLKVDDIKRKICHTHHGGINIEWWGKNKPPFNLNLIAISQWMSKVYKSQGFNARPIYNPVDISTYQYKAQKGDRLLFVGRASKLKQPHIAIEVAKKLGMGLDLVVGTFVDDKNYLEQVKAMCDGKQIVWIPEPPQEVKYKLYQDAKCVLFPSNMGEPFGLVPIEAMSCGTPVIATPDGAIPEVVEHGVTGFIYNTVDEMCEAVKKIDSISTQDCRNRVSEKFSIDVIARQYQQAYFDIIDGKEW